MIQAHARFTGTQIGSTFERSHNQGCKFRQKIQSESEELKKIQSESERFKKIKSESEAKAKILKFF